MRHTPGPWKHDKDGHRIVSTTSYEVKDVDGLDDIPTSIVCLYGAMGGTDTEADARLIAAAPLLLQTLEEVSEYFDARADIHAENERAPNEEMRWLMDIRAALAAAKGEQG